MYPASLPESRWVNPMIDPIRKAGARFPLRDLDLVIWERDPRWAVPDHLYIVVGDPKRRGDYPQKIVRRIANARTCPQHQGSITLGEVAAQSELIPISAFGLVAVPQSLHHCRLELREDPELRPALRSDGSLQHWYSVLPTHPPDLTGTFHPDWHEAIVESTHRRLAEAA